MSAQTTTFAPVIAYGFGDLLPLAHAGNTATIESYLSKQSVENLTKHVNTVVSVLEALGGQALTLVNALLSGRDESSAEAMFWGDAWMTAQCNAWGV